MKTILTLVLLGSASLSSAAIAISGGGAGSESGLGFFTGSLDYVATNATTASLTVNLKNTSPAANGGYLTGFAFNLPSGPTFALAFYPPVGDFDSISGSVTSHAVNASPFGQFNIAISTGSPFNGGGPPSAGLAVSQSATFVINFFGTGLNTINTQSFLNELSEGSGAGQGYKSFVVRFRGFENDGSDKVPGTTSVVPEPSSYAMVLAAGIGVMTAIRKRRAAK